MLTENDGFSFDREYILQDERVLLRPLTMEDFDFLVEYSIHEPQLFQYSLSQAIGEEGLKNTPSQLFVNAREIDLKSGHNAL